MEITEVRVKLMEDPDDRLRAFCSITFDNCFVVRDLKIIDGTSGLFVAMPSRKLTFHCPKCGSKNHLRANFCNQCGARLREHHQRDQEGRAKLYADIAHPINSECRDVIQARVIEEFHAELERSGQPGYVSRYDEEYESDYEKGDYDGPADSATTRPAAEQPPSVAPSTETPPDENRTLRADTAQQPSGPHAPEKSPGESAPVEKAGEMSSEPPSEKPPGKSSFGEGVFDEDQE